LKLPFSPFSPKGVDLYKTWFGLSFNPLLHGGNMDNKAIYMIIKIMKIDKTIFMEIYIREECL